MPMDAAVFVVTMMWSNAFRKSKRILGRIYNWSRSARRKSRKLTSAHAGREVVMGLSDAGLEVFPRYAVYHCHVHLARKSKTLIMGVRGLASSTANSLIR